MAPLLFIGAAVVIKLARIWLDFLIKTAPREDFRALCVERAERLRLHGRVSYLFLFAGILWIGQNLITVYVLPSPVQESRAVGQTLATDVDKGRTPADQSHQLVTRGEEP